MRPPNRKLALFLAGIWVLFVLVALGPATPFYRLWFERGVPVVGRVVSGSSAYTYLPASVRRFPGPEDLAGLLREAGFGEVRYRLFARGIVALHLGVAE